MMTYEFQSTLYRNASEMHEAIAYAWLSAGGLNDEQTQREFLTQSSNEEFADEAIAAWELDDPEWSGQRDFSRAALIEAFENLRRANAM